MPTKIDDKTFEDFGLREVVGHRNPSTPEFTENTVSIPGMDGVWSFGHKMGTRSFEIPLKHLYNDMYKRQRFLNDLVAFLFNEYGKPREIKLIFDYEPDKYFLVKLSGQINPERLIFSNSFSLTFRATDPKKYFVSSSEEITWENDSIPIYSDILWITGEGVHSISSPSTIEVLNNGTLVQIASFTISGTGTNVGFSCNGKSFNLGTFINTTFEIDGKTYSVKKNGVDSFSALSGKFIELLPGINSVQITGTNLNLTIQENIKYAYM